MDSCFFFLFIFAWGFFACLIGRNEYLFYFACSGVGRWLNE